MSLLSLALLAGCHDDPSKTTSPTDSPTDPTTPTPPGDTGTPPITTPTGPPASLSVTCDPTDNALRFTCTVDVDPPQPVELSFVRTDGRSPARQVSSADALGEHVLPLYFMAPEVDYDVTAWATAWPDDPTSTSITTGSLPASFATSLQMTGTSTMGLVGTNYPCSSDAVAVVYDTNTGDLVWYELMDPGGQFGGVDMVRFTEDHTVLGESQGDVVEVDLEGADVIRLNDLDQAFGVTATGLFGNFHHDIMKRNGVYYVFYQETYGGGGFNADVLDNVILFDGTGTEITRWYPIDHLALPSDWGGDFLHTNSIDVDTSGDMLLSWHTQDTIAKIEGDWTSPDFGTPVWILRGSPSGEVGNTITTDWSAVPAPSTLSGQHDLNLRPDGRLMLLDNDHGRGLVLSLDEAAGTATVDASYPTHDGRCGPQGTSVSTLGGNAVVGCAGTWVDEYDGTTGDPVWEAHVQCSGGGGGGYRAGAVRWYPLEGW